MPVLTRVVLSHGSAGVEKEWFSMETLSSLKSAGLKINQSQDAGQVSDLAQASVLLSGKWEE